MIEYVDVYDSAKKPTGRTQVRAHAHFAPGEYQLYVTAIVEDLTGRILITRRALDKGWAAGWWEVTGGGALAGETSEQAVVREVAEEVGLDVSQAAPSLAYAYRNDDAGGDNYFMDVYRFALDITCDDVTLQESEAIDCRLATWDEIVELHEQGVFLHFGRIATALGHIS